MSEYKTKHRALYEQGIQRIEKRAARNFLFEEVCAIYDAEILSKLLDGKLLDQIDFFQAADDACCEWDC